MNCNSFVDKILDIQVPPNGTAVVAGEPKLLIFLFYFYFFFAKLRFYALGWKDESLFL